MKNYLYKQPKYFSEFKCIGGACPETCCAEWEINWNIENIEKLRNSNCSDELKKKADCSFRLNTNNKYEIILNNDGSCPFLTNEKLCMIQKELGEDILSYVCRIYPRQTQKVKNIFTRVCSVSCYAVIDILCNDENSVDLVLREVKESSVDSGLFDKDTLLNKPELNYFNEIFDFLHEILNNKSRDIEISIILGALAAKKISDFAIAGKADMIPEVIKKLRLQINNQAQIDSINNMKSNYVFSVGVVNDILKNIYRKDVITALYTDGKPDVDKYNIGMQKYNDAFTDNKYALKNIIINYFMEMFSFKYKKDFSVYDNYLYFAFTAAAVKLSCAVVGFACGPEDDIKKEFIHYQAIYARRLDNGVNVVPIVIEYLKEKQWNTPAYIASMIK